MTGRILCGAPVYPKELADGRGDRDPLMMVTCRNTAPCVVHRDRDLSPAADIPASDPAPGLEAAIARKSTQTSALTREALRQVCTCSAVVGGVPVEINPDCPVHGQPVDLRPLLTDDTQAWSVRSRLTKSLGRPALATRLADALPPLLGAELADRLDTLITQALTEQQAQITQELSDSYYAARARLDADAAAKLKELRNERHRGVSRFS